MYAPIVLHKRGLIIVIKCVLQLLQELLFNNRSDLQALTVENRYLTLRLTKELLSNHHTPTKRKKGKKSARKIYHMKEGSLKT